MESDYRDYGAMPDEEWQEYQKQEKLKRLACKYPLGSLYQDKQENVDYTLGKIHEEMLFHVKSLQNDVKRECCMRQAPYLLISFYRPLYVDSVAVSVSGILTPELKRLVKLAIEEL